MSVRILIVDDHEIVREGIRTLIFRSRPEWQICGEATNGEDAIEAATTLKPDIIILDITMPKMSGLEAALKIAERTLGSRILMFTMHNSERLVKEVQQAQAQGLVLKSQAARDLIRAIDALLAGGTFFETEPTRTGGGRGTSSSESASGRSQSRSGDMEAGLLRLEFCGARTRRRVGRQSSFARWGAYGNSIRKRQGQA